MRGGWVERGTVMIRLTRAHFAFYRGYLEGIELRTLTRRYLDATAGSDRDQVDLRVARSSIDWIRRQLVAAARRSPQPSTARLFQASLEKLHLSQEKEAPTLEQYREERDPHEFYTEQELLELFAADFGRVSSRQARVLERNRRLQRRQLRALAQLEELVVADPKLSDGVDGWFDPVVAQRLRQANVLTLAQLIELIRVRGYHWYKTVPRIGVKAGAHIVSWLQEPSVSAALQVSFHPRVLMRRSELPEAMPPARPRQTAIVPLETLHVPEALDGRHGTNRGVRPGITAANDLEAIHAWLGSCQRGSHTLRSYRREAERLMLWAIIENRKAVSSFTEEDCIRYGEFLRQVGRTDPEPWGQRFRIPQASWIGPRGAERWSDAWRPFEGSLAPSSQVTALAVVRALFAWLTAHDYLHANPMKGMRNSPIPRKAIDTPKTLSPDDWNTIEGYLGSLPETVESLRLRFVLGLARETGMRLSELVAARRGDVRASDSANEGARWLFAVPGKASSAPPIPLSFSTIESMVAYFRGRGYADVSSVPLHLPLIAALPSHSMGGQAASGTEYNPLSTSGLYKMLKRFFHTVADDLDKASPQQAIRLRQVSAQWLRQPLAKPGRIAR